MSDDQGEAIFRAAKLLQLYEETENIEAVTEAATALFAERPSDYVRQAAWFLPPELIRSPNSTAPASYRCDLALGGSRSPGCRHRHE